MSKPAEKVADTLQAGDARRSGGYRALLRNRAFFWLWLGQTVSSLGNGIYSVGLAWTVYSVTGSSADMGFIMAMNAVPQLLLLFLGGTVADRYPRVIVLRASDTVAGAVTLVMTVLAMVMQPAMPELIACAFLLGVTTAFYNPSYAAVSGDMVNQAALPEASALLSVSANTARIAGPALAGAVYSLGGIRASFCVDSSTFFVAAAASTVVIRQIPATRPDESDRLTVSNFTHNALAGLTYVRKNDWLRAIIVLSVVANAVTLPAYFVLLPGLVRSMDGSASVLGALSAIQVCASIGSALVLGRIRNRFVAGRQLYVLGAAVGLGVIATAAYHLNQGFVVLGILLVGIGFAIEVPENTLLQSQVPREIISRVYSVAIALSYSFLPIGLAGAGLAAHIYGQGLVLACSGLLLLGTIAVLPLTRSGKAVLSLNPAGDRATKPRH